MKAMNSMWKGLFIMAADSREVMNIRQASQYLGVSPDTLYKYVYEEKIPLSSSGTAGSSRRPSSTVGWSARAR